MERPIGLLGGTFDPIHYGHLRPALEAIELLRFAELRFIPSGVPPHRDAPMASAAQRLAMLELAIEDQPGFIIDTREMKRPGPSYMFDTLTSLRDEVGADRPLCLLLGIDAFLSLPSWHRWEELCALAHLVVLHRPGWATSADDGALTTLLSERRVDDVQVLFEHPAGSIYFHQVTQLDISGSAIRALCANGQSPRYLLPEAVWSYMRREGFYRVE